MTEFALEIKGSQPVPNSTPFYRSLLHGQEYSVVCHNPGWTPCDVALQIDGMNVGRWRIEARSHIVIERPVGVAKKFTFVKEDSALAASSGVTKHADNGLVSATFYPEVQKNVEACLVPQGLIAEGPSRRGLVAEGGRSHSSGATVLGDASSQKFGTATALYAIDHAKVKTVNIRIVAREPVMPVTASLRSYPEAVLRGNPVPPRWEDFSQEITRE